MRLGAGGSFRLEAGARGGRVRLGVASWGRDLGPVLQTWGGSFRLEAGASNSGPVLQTRGRCFRLEAGASDLRPELQTWGRCFKLGAGASDLRRWKLEASAILGQSLNLDLDTVSARPAYKRDFEDNACKVIRHQGTMIMVRGHAKRGRGEEIRVRGSVKSEQAREHQ